MGILQIYCDGGCRGNQHDANIGGWGAVLIWGEHVKEVYGGEPDTTNNKMELTAAIRGLQAVKDKRVETHVYVDSAYVLNGITGWIDGWKRNGWVNAKKQPVANKKLWLALDAEKQQFAHIEFHKVKGHSDNRGNERADELANLGMDKVQRSLE